MSDTTVLVTGAAGFIGMHTCLALLAQRRLVIGLDNLTPYYDVKLKARRLDEIARLGGSRFRFVQADIADPQQLERATGTDEPSAIIHLAAQAGVRHSIENPMAYAHSNLVGMTTMLEFARKHPPKHFIYASSSSVYGGNSKIPFSETDRVDKPVSFYAATKRANEVMAYSYSHLYSLAMTGLRFFTVYGPWGRPDMAPWLFTEAILGGRPIRVYGRGLLSRDFTYVDDVVEAVCRLVDHPPAAQSDQAAHALYNIGNNSPNSVNELVAAIEAACGRRAIREELPIPAGDVARTYADTQMLQDAIGFKPTTSLTDGVARFVDWFRSHHDLPGGPTARLA